MIIIFGGTGMLGFYVSNILSSHYNVRCITREVFDISSDSWDKLTKLLSKLTPLDIVINCAGIIPQKIHEDNYKVYFRVNAMFPNKLASLSERLGFHFIHITTDCIFNGNKVGSYNEKDKRLKYLDTGLYGISKSFGEPENACIIRTSIIGEELLGKKSLLEWIKSNREKIINGFDNHYWNGVTCLTLANIIRKIIKYKLYWQGIRHIYSPDIVTKYTLCKMINDIYKLNITINKINTSKSCNRVLSSIYNTSQLFNIPSLYDQILTQMHFTRKNIHQIQSTRV